MDIFYGKHPMNWLFIIQSYALCWLNTNFLKVVYKDELSGNSNNDLSLIVFWYTGTHESTLKVYNEASSVRIFCVKRPEDWP